MIARALAAYADVFTLCQASFDGLADQGLYGRIALIKVHCQQRHAGVAVEAQSQLGQVI
jgi:hypothetical protein